MINLVLLFTVLGSIFNFLGTVILVFSLPAFFMEDNKGFLYIGDKIRGSSERPGAKKTDFSTSIKDIYNLFKKRVCNDRDKSTILALIFLVLGNIFQVMGVWLSTIDC